jgi:hypothetical protein
MITAVDSSVLLDVLTDDPRQRRASFAALRAARERGALVACPAVWAEVASFFAAPGEMASALSAAGIEFDPFDREASELAGRLWRGYRESGGQRTRLIADFLIGAHALTSSGRLLTRDRGFYRRYFHDLEVITPSFDLS